MIHEKARAIFIDRDGTLNHDPGYLSEPHQVRLIPGVAASLKRLKEAGFRIVVVSNQSGVARGLIDAKSIPLIHGRLDELLIREGGVAVDAYEICPLMPDDSKTRRKPKPDLILDAAARLDIEVADSFMVGDRGSDVEAGRRAGCKGSVLVQTGVQEKDLTVAPDFVGEDLSAVTDWILSRKNGA